MTINTSYVPDTVKQILQDNLNPSLARFRDLEDPDYDAQDIGTFPIVELEFAGAALEMIEWGAPGNNVWQDEGAFSIHVHVDRFSQSISDARAVMDACLAIFVGKTIGDIVFRDALPEYVDYGDEGRTRGVTRSVEYNYEFQYV